MLLCVDKINPEEKDYVRALDLDRGGEPDLGKASRMAKAITDPAKLVRRSKAVVGIWGTESAWTFFKLELKITGFTEEEIAKISEFEIDEDNL